MKWLTQSLLFFLLFNLSLSAWAAINAWLDRDRIGPGESVQLTIQHDGGSNSQPDLSPLKQDFDILGRSSGSSIQIVNGRMSSQTQLTLLLSPRRSGQLAVPALTWDGETTPALSLTVAAGGGATSPDANMPAGQASHVFLTASTDQKQPYVQSAVTLTVRLYTDEPLYQASLELEPSNDMLVQQIGKDSQTRASKSGHEYKVIERKYLLFPQRSGHLRLDGPVLNAQAQTGQAANPFGNDPFFGRIFGGVMGSAQPIRVRADPVVLDVRPRPASGRGHGWLPAQKVTLAESWQPDKGPIHVGDPITRRLNLSALGLTASQLPDLSQIMPVPPGLRAYPDQAKLDTGVQGDTVLGNRDQDIALIASRAGRYELPALRLYWWDTTRNLQREVDLPAHTLVVLPASAAFSAATVPPSQSSSTPPSAGQSMAESKPARPVQPTDGIWKWLNLGLALLWLATLAGWLWTRRGRVPRAPARTAAEKAAPEISSSAAHKAFREACRADAAAAARQHVLQWARTAWPNDPPLGLKALAERLDDMDLKALLAELDRACYAGGEWHGTNLLDRLSKLPDKSGREKRSGLRLAQLYP